MNNVNMIKFESITTIQMRLFRPQLVAITYPTVVVVVLCLLVETFLLLQTFRAQMVRHITDLQINTVMLAGIGQETSF